MLTKILFIVTVVALKTMASPVPAKRDSDKVLYDQRQEGEWNVRADLDNFVILVIPTQTATNSVATSPSILDFLKKSLPRGTYVKRVKHVKKQNPDAAQETMHFIESKTAPYHVDISESNLHVNPTSENTLLARSPSVALNKPTDVSGLNQHHKRRSARTLVLTLPKDEEFVVTNTEDKKKVVKKDGKKKTTKDIPRTTLVLLGAENEQCGPGMVRDSYGICRTFKKNL